ncbi:hypothetical protein ABT317_29210 [Streptomyces carpinensis]|uniref:Uncharacterized protein n=1 Tax=Streptomyces carpinensis TaxID=66369 RepID=A0ABV1WAU4_9ACTN
MTASPLLLGEPDPAPSLVGAPAEPLEVAGALEVAVRVEADPLAESEVSGEVGGVEVGAVDSGGVDVGGSEVGGVDVGGVDVGGFGGCDRVGVGDFGGLLDVPPVPGFFVPVGSSDGWVVSAGGVGSSDVP